MRAVAPTMIGSAIVRESRFAWSREKRRQRAAARVTPLRETPGASAAAWASRARARRPAPASPRPRSLRPACRRPASPPRRRAGRPRSPAARRAAARSAARACSRRPPRAGRRAPSTSARRAGRSARSSSAITRRWPISSAAAAPACSATSKLLRTSGSSSLPVPAGEPGDEDDVGGAGDRQQLGRALDDARARPRAGLGSGRRPRRSSAAGAGRLGRRPRCGAPPPAPPPPRRRLTSR